MSSFVKYSGDDFSLPFHEAWLDGAVVAVKYSGVSFRDKQRT